MSVLDTVVKPLIEWIRSEFPSDIVVHERGNAHRPNTPHWLVSVTTPLRKLGFSDDVYYDEKNQPVDVDDEYLIVGQRSVTVSVKYVQVRNHDDVTDDYYEPQDRVKQLIDTLENPVKIEVLHAGGLSPWQWGDILDLTTLIESGYEPRAGVDIVMGLGSCVKARLGTIRQTKVTGKVDGTTEPENTIGEED